MSIRSVWGGDRVVVEENAESVGRECQSWRLERKEKEKEKEKERAKAKAKGQGVTPDEAGGWRGK
jgi:hypothetical protein